jgi:photosystem II stability/assembly factor-like uncharacterized protein
MRVLATLVAIVAVAAATLYAVEDSSAATASTTVGVTVASAVTLTNNCQNNAAYNFGVVAPGTSNVTATNANVCSLTFGSTNDTAMLRVGQADGNGAAMANPVNNSGAITTDNSDFVMDVASFSSSLTWEVTEGGHAKRSVDGGNTWPIDDVVTGSRLDAIAADKSDGTGNTWYAVGVSGAVYKSTNAAGGSPTWALTAAQPSGVGWTAGNDAWDVTVYTDGSAVDNVIVVGDNGYTARSTNGGTSWTFNQVGTTRLGGVSALSGTSNVFAVGCNTFVTSANSGSTFTAGTSTNEGCENTVAAADATHVYATGNGGLVKWNGAAWTKLIQRDYFSDVDVVPGTPADVVAVGIYGNVYLTTNSGGAWTRLDSKTGDTLNAVTMPTTTQIIGVGADGVSTVSADGSTFTKTNEIAGKTDYLGVSAPPDSGQHVVEVGSSDAVRYSNDGAQTWTAGSAPAGTALFAVDMTTGTTGWAVGENGMIVGTTDGGATWTQQGAGLTTNRLRAVCAVNSSVAFAAGDGGTVLETTNGGTSWYVLAAGAGAADLYGVWSPDGTTVMVDGTSSTVRRSTDGGATWATPTNPGGSVNLKQMDGMGSTVYIAGSYNVVWKSSDAGATWSSLATTYTKDYDYVSVASPTVVWFGDQTTTFVETTDGGTTWTAPLAPGTDFGTFSNIAAVDAHTAYASGDDYFSARWTPNSAANSTVSDYSGGTNWASSSATTNMFGICLQAVNASTTANAPFTLDTFNTSGQCQTLDSDPWEAIPGTVTKAAYTTVAGNTGRADFVFGFRPSNSQLPGNYTANVVFEAVAPAV